MKSGSVQQKKVPMDARQRLLNAAITLFTTRGYGLTTVREIVEAAEVTKPVLYYYFRNKEGIYLEICKEVESRIGILEQMSATSQGSCEEKLKRFFRHVYALIVENIGVMRMIHSVVYGPQQGVPYYNFEVLHQRLMGIVKKYVIEGIAQGDIPPKDDLDLSILFFSILNYAIESLLSKECVNLNGDGIDRMIGMLFEFMNSGKQN